MTCQTCAHFAPLSPGHAAICFKRWTELPWNAAVPLTTADDGCDKHTPATGSVTTADARQQTEPHKS